MGGDSLPGAHSAGGSAGLAPGCKLVEVRARETMSTPVQFAKCRESMLRSEERTAPKKACFRAGGDR